MVEGSKVGHVAFRQRRLATLLGQMRETRLAGHSIYACAGSQAEAYLYEFPASCEFVI